MGKALIILVAVVLLVYAFFDLAATRREQVPMLPKLLWFPVIVLLPFVGPLLWIITSTAIARRQDPPPSPGSGWGRPPAKGPDDDPDFLRGL